MSKLKIKRAKTKAKQSIAGYQIESKTSSGVVTIYFNAREFSKHEVETYRILIDKIEVEKKKGSIYEGTLEEVRRFPILWRKLIDRGIINAPKAEFWTLPQLRRAYIEAGYKDGKAENTLRNQDNSLKKLEGIFGAITLDELDADAARGFVDLIDRNVADGTISGSTRAGYIRDVKSAFNWAVAEGIVSKNPFDGIKKGSFRNESRKEYIDQELTRAVLEACRNSDHPLEWRALFALARFQGLRVPSETRALRWQDVDFDSRQLTITSQKTKRYEGKDRRVMPLFAPTLAILQELRETRPKNQVFVFADLLPQMRSESNIRTGLLRVLNRAGLVPWKKLFCNLRASAATDVAKVHGAIAESRWIGHTEKVADDHYLQVLPSAQRDEAGLFSNWM